MKFKLFLTWNYKKIKTVQNMAKLDFEEEYKIYGFQQWSKVSKMIIVFQLEVVAAGGGARKRRRC